MAYALSTILTVNIELDQKPLGPLSAHHPTVQTLTCSKQELLEALTASALTALPSSSSALCLEETQESIYETLEYLDLVALASPRVQATDQIDSFLSRYAVPDPSESSNSVKTMTWSGLISSRWILELVCSIM
jgi:ribonuclease P/MRP protein subunit RPP40